MEEKNKPSPENQQETITLYALIPAEYHRKLKHWCIENGKTIKDFICDCIQALPKQR